VTRRALGLTLLTLFLPAAAQQKAPVAKKPTLLARISQIKPGSVTTDHRCVLILPDHRFHLERATRKRAKDLMRKVYEGEFSQAEWDQLMGVLAAPDLKALTVPSTRGVLVVEDMDLITIAIWRDPGYQSMEFLTKRDRAPYERTLKPLLEWWKGFAKQGLKESNAPVSPYCALSSNDMIFAP
jgi:hypothetical protein